MAAGLVTSVVFAIDTTDYSGNFEREMCAFVTGQVGECGVGDQFIDEALDEICEKSNDAYNWLNDHTVQEADDADSPCYRPCSIWPTPGRVNNGSGGHFNEADIKPEECWAGTHWPAYESVAIFFDGVPPKEVIDIMIERAKWFAQNRPDHRSYMGELKPLTITGFRVLEPTLLKPRQVEHKETARYEV